MQSRRREEETLYHRAFESMTVNFHLCNTYCPVYFHFLTIRTFISISPISQKEDEINGPGNKMAMRVQNTMYLTVKLLLPDAMKQLRRRSV